MKRIMYSKVLCGALALSTLTGIANTAIADDCCRWELKVKRKAILSDNFEVELWAHFPDDKYAFGSAQLDILTNGVEWVKIGDPCMLGIGMGHQGDIVGDDVLNIVVGQVNFPPAAIFADPANPIRVWCGEFEASGGAPFRSIWTQTEDFQYYEEMDSAVKESCDPTEAFRSAFVGPIVIDDWIAAPFPGTIGVPDGEGLVLRASPGADGVGAAMADLEGVDRLGNFEIQRLMSDDPALAPVDLVWHPWWECFDFPFGTLRTSMVVEKPVGGARTAEVTPDFSDIGVRRIPAAVRIGDRVVADVIIPAGGSFRLFDPCIDPTWCYVLNQFDQLVLVLKCDSLFGLEIAGTRYTADTIELQTGVSGDQVGGLDRVELMAPGHSSLTIHDAGPISSGCRADCDGDGRLSIFDFLCFQNLFGSGDLAADFDGDGRLTIFDFLEFQNEFVAGCD